MVAVLERVSQKTLRVVREPQIPGRPPVDQKRASELDAAVASGASRGGVGTTEIDATPSNFGADFLASYTAARSLPENRDLPPGDSRVIAAVRASLKSEVSSATPPVVPASSSTSVVAK